VVVVGFRVVRSIHIRLRGTEKLLKSEHLFWNLPGKDDFAE